MADDRAADLTMMRSNCVRPSVLMVLLSRFPICLLCRMVVFTAVLWGVHQYTKTSA